MCFHHSPQGGLVGSVLTYHCGLGKYPFPVSSRLCGANGEWSLMRLANGRPVSQATCKGNIVTTNASVSFVHIRTLLSVHKLIFLPVISSSCPPPSFLPCIICSLFHPHCSSPLLDVLCPAQLQLDHGDFWPRDQWFRVGTVQSFSCMEGFTLYGSAQRNCTLSAEWTGTTPVCDNHGMLYIVFETDLIQTGLIDHQTIIANEPE